LGGGHLFLCQKQPFNCICYCISQKLEQDIEEMQQSYRVGSVMCVTDHLKLALITETKNWKMAYSKALNEKCASEMDDILEFIENLTKKLSRPVKDLDDVRSHMASLAEIREAEIRVDMTITPIEETYAMLHKYNIFFNDGNAERVDTLSYGWKKLIAQVSLTEFSFENMQSVLITTKVGSSNPVHGKVYSIQRYVIKFVSDLRQIGGFLWELLFPPPIN
jgi:Asp-tRNA(Asn)/Glu-tRNA(Gln) amidotransferase C subunit